MGREDQAWFDALSGKTDAGKAALLLRELRDVELEDATLGIARQAARLRKVLRDVELDDAAQEDTSLDWQRLQFAMRREEAKGRTSYKYYALAASILIVVGTITMLMPEHEAVKQTPQDAASVMRGTSEQVILSADPTREAQQLEAELGRLGIKVTRRGDAEKIALHIQLTYPVKDAVRAALESRIIPVPEQGDLSVVFIRSSH